MRSVMAHIVGCERAADAGGIVGVRLRPDGPRIHVLAKVLSGEIFGNEHCSASGFYNRVPPGERRAAEASIGAETYLHVHHHCAGLAWLARAKLEGNKQVRTHMLNRARDESGYTLRNVTPASALFTAINTNLARVAQAQDKIPLAEEYLNEAIKARPTDPLAYLSLALLYRDTKRLDAARQILETGMTATDSKSVELHYSLGLVCLELKDKTCAVEHAHVAYAEGYPLPGLKDKLIKQDLWRE